MDSIEENESVDFGTSLSDDEHGSPEHQELLDRNEKEKRHKVFDSKAFLKKKKKGLKPNYFMKQLNTFF